MDIDTINVIVLVFLGDAVYDTYIRKKLIGLGIQKVEELQNKAIEYVSAKGQVKILNYLINNNILSDFELDIVKRGRNNKRSSHPKNTDILTYKLSTGFEALIGYLYLSNKIDRLEEILSFIEVR